MNEHLTTIGTAAKKLMQNISDGTGVGAPAPITDCCGQMEHYRNFFQSVIDALRASGDGTPYALPEPPQDCGV